MPKPTDPIMDGNLIRHRDTILKCVQGSFIATNNGEVSMELLWDRGHQERFREWAKSKGVPEFLGENLT